MFTVQLDQLHDGKKVRIQKKLEPSFMEINEKELVFKEFVHIKGEAYLADNDLIIHLAIQATAHLPCIICNQMTPVSIEIPNFYLAQPIKNISQAFDFRLPLREAILLEVPSYAECNHGQCKERENITPFMTKKKIDYPFKDL